MKSGKHKVFIGAGTIALVYLVGFSGLMAVEYRSPQWGLPERFIPLPELDTQDYDARMYALAKVSTTTLAMEALATSTASTSSPQATKARLWPAQAPYPNARAILPFKRVVAYYGNFYSTKMGVLGEYETEEMLAKLASTTAAWTEADPNTPAIPAIHYIAAVAQATAGKEGKYILRMPDDQIDHALALAERIDGIVFLDVQVGQSTLAYELPHLEKYLKMPQVHLGIDPEFSMKKGERPGTVIGTFDAVDINYAVEYLAGLVRDNHLPPKMLVIHRFTNAMMTNYKNIKPLPEVQVVIDMDGFGSKALKKGTWSRVIYPEPVQFAGIKLFYKNDARSAGGMFTPSEVLDLTPIPIYVQYQ
jgi:hypothetical protein